MRRGRDAVGGAGEQRVRSSGSPRPRHTTTRISSARTLRRRPRWADGRRATLDIGAECPHRSQFEICTDSHVIKVDDLVGGQGRSGDFSAYFVPYVGSDKYALGDAMGKDEVVSVEPSDHVMEKVRAFARCVLDIKAGGKPDPEWAKRALATHAGMCAVFESSQQGGKVVTL